MHINYLYFRPSESVCNKNSLWQWEKNRWLLCISAWLATVALFKAFLSVPLNHMKQAWQARMFPHLPIIILSHMWSRIASDKKNDGCYHTWSSFDDTMTIMLPVCEKRTAFNQTPGAVEHCMFQSVMSAGQESCWSKRPGCNNGQLGLVKGQQQTWRWNRKCQLKPLELVF